MKKFMVFACAVLSSAAMQAQDIKTILGAEKYTDALELIKQGGGNLSNEDKAKAYNKVVDLALAKYNKEAEIKISNEVKNENKGFDQNGMSKRFDNWCKTNFCFTIFDIPLFSNFYSDFCHDYLPLFLEIAFASDFDLCSARAFLYL